MADDSIDGIIDLFPLYEPEHRFLKAFWQFAYRLNSLYRQWNWTKTQIPNYLYELRSASDGSPEAEIFLGEILCDEEFFPEFLRGAVISHGLTLLESMLDDVAKEVASTLGETVNLDFRPMPYINRYVLYLTRSCGLDLKIPRHLWKQLDAIRELRNRYIHKLDRDLPAEIRDTLESLVAGIPNGDTIDNGRVEHGLAVVAEVGKKVELAFWHWYETRIETLSD